MFLVDYVDGAWVNSRIVPYGPLSIAPGAVALHYAQEIFDGAKAFLHDDGDIYAFRIEKYVARLNRSASMVCMPVIPEELQLEAILTLIDVERLWCPRQEGASLYIRPFMIGTDDSLGVKPSSGFAYGVFLSPCGSYYPSGFTTPIKLLITKRYHRAVPGGVGASKTGGNYAASLRPGELARSRGAQQVLYVDSTNRYVEEAGSMNHFHVTVRKEVIIPPFSETVLRSITSESVIELGQSLGLEVRQEQVELESFLEGIRSGVIAECGGFGTAAVVSSVGAYILEEGGEVSVGRGEIGEVTSCIYDTITGIQRGHAAAPAGWLTKVPRVL